MWMGGFTLNTDITKIKHKEDNLLPHKLTIEN